MSVSARLERWVLDNVAVPLSDDVLRSLQGLEGDLSSERVQAGIVFGSDGRRDRFESQMQLAHIDWRDVLVNGGLDDEEWPDVLDRRLGRQGP